ncbi:MAG: hypothetical protein V4582_11020 [Pseudomonadota bacterium]
MRDWVLAHIPLTSSAVGFDLFLKIGKEVAAERVPRLQEVLAALPHPPEAVRAHLLEMKAAGLIVLLPDIDDAACQLLPTAALADLLEQYHAKFESLFIPRTGLREQQLLVCSADADLNALATSIYDHAYDLGWLYLHNFGAVCFLMASLIARVARFHGHQAELVSGYVDIDMGEQRFLLGAQGYALPGQVDGHAFCVIDGKLIVDFGLGNVRRGFRRNFFWGLACDVRQQGAEMGVIALPGGGKVSWKNDWSTPETQSQLAQHEAFAERYAREYMLHYQRLTLAVPLGAERAGLRHPSVDHPSRSGNSRSQ